jgi:hypothetical protein
MGRHVTAVMHRRFEIPTYKDSEKLRGERMLAPPTGSQPLPGGPGGYCRYPEDWVPPRTSIKSRKWLPPSGWGQLQGCHVSQRLWLPPSGSGQLWGHHVPRSSGSSLLARGSSETTTWHLGSSTHHRAHGSSGGATCPEDGFCRPQENKQIPPFNQAIMISIGARTHVSSKMLRDKGCPARSQGVQ